MAQSIDNKANVRDTSQQRPVTKRSAGNPVKLYLTPAEKEQLKRLAQSHRLPQQQFIRACVFEEPIRVKYAYDPDPQLEALIQEWRREGVNVNQMSRALNRIARSAEARGGLDNKDRMLLAGIWRNLEDVAETIDDLSDEAMELM